jgi:hypothetical protein
MLLLRRQLPYASKNLIHDIYGWIMLLKLFKEPINIILR